MTTSEKVAYLKGLAEGLKIDEEKPEGKLISVIIDILEDMALDIEDVSENALDLSEEIDELSEDLALLEDLIYDDEDDDDEDEDDCCCGHHGHAHSHRGGCCGGDDFDEPLFFEVKCPSCENEITVDEDVLNLGKIQCPNCGEMLEFDFDEDEDDEDEDED